MGAKVSAKWLLRTVAPKDWPPTRKWQHNSIIGKALCAEKFAATWPPTFVFRLGLEPLPPRKRDHRPLWQPAPADRPRAGTPPAGSPMSWIAAPVPASRRGESDTHRQNPRPRV